MKLSTFGPHYIKEIAYFRVGTNEKKNITNLQLLRRKFIMRFIDDTSLRDGIKWLAYKSGFFSSIHANHGNSSMNF